MGFGGAALKFLQTALYALEFCAAAIILGIFSYFLSVLADRDLVILDTWKAVTGISGAAVLYTILAVLLTCCLGGKAFFAFLGMVLDVAFAGAFVAIAVLTRDGVQKCTGDVTTPLGQGPVDSAQGFGSDSDGNQFTYSASLGAVCRLTTASFACAIAGAGLFLISALVQFCLGRHHKREKRFGPSPSNGYSRGTGTTFFGRRRAKKGTVQDAEMAGAVPATGTTHLAPGAPDYRPSHDTAYTGSTVAPPAGTYENNHKPLAGGYHTAPTGTYNSTAKY
ncbi:hypothetical protein P280DRAFT_470680 [Massarina eburnea CBS 473.64]|uniref:MARVEL domain-containing protein n=1 Tax=Massarina eburnea CBS 473.64 TaxID=1395130 RepID=A0A6A6RWC3_9PLEO|nr:hypothetical protein P280DRAFT_470680 [Massarina eburnea CBS 473.64]